MPPGDSTTTSDDPSPRDLPSRRGETWNDTEAIARHQTLTPSARIALAIETSRAALLFARRPPFEPSRIVAALNDHGVEFVVVGDLAGAAHGVVRATDHLELALRSDADVVDRFTRAFKGSRDVRLSSAPYERLRSTAITVDFGRDTTAPVCSLDELRALKRASRRPRDRIDLAELDELHGYAA